MQFFNSDLVAEFTRVQQEFGLARGALHVELTESSLMRKPAQAMQTMQRLHEQGIRLFRGRTGPWTTVDLINQAGGLKARNQEQYGVDIL